MRRLVLVLLLAAVLFTALPVRVSTACSCAGRGNRTEALRSTDVAFKGTVTGRTDPEGGDNVISSGRDVFYDFDVDEVLKGEVDDPAQVVTAADGASCGAGFAVGRRYLVFGTVDGPRLTSGLCAGNERLKALPVAAQDDVRPVAQTESPSEADANPGDLPAPTATERPVLATLAALAAAGAVIALAVGRARQRNRLDDPPT